MAAQDERSPAQPFFVMSTIAAIATPTGTGALSLIRISGSRTRDVILAACVGLKEMPQPRRATLVQLCAAGGEVLDTGLLTYFPAPHSFTGEDVAEFCGHGGRFVTQRVLDRILACGARPAEPGEFTRRAFENGKIDLTRAEAVMDIINAESDLALRAAQHQLAGGIADPVEQAIDTLVSVCALVEAHIDFPEEDIPAQSIEHILADVRGVAGEIDELLTTAVRGRLLREGIRVAIIGAPNVGKSSLLNRLLGYDRAIVSDFPGTTRDTVEENINWGGVALRLIDTAGIRASDDAVEQVGIQRTRAALETADLILEVRDASVPYQALAPGDSDNSVHRIVLLNKADLPRHASHKEGEGLLISCRTGMGFETLRQRILDTFSTEALDVQASAAAINTRHRLALAQALDALHRAESLLVEQAQPELLSIELREALDALGSITGRVDTEDVLSRIFSSFCIGK